MNTDAKEHARVMLLPPQQRLPDSLAEALEGIVAADSPSALVISLQEVCRLSREQGYL